jgi:hypothetical protein
VTRKLSGVFVRFRAPLHLDKTQSHSKKELIIILQNISQYWRASLTWNLFEIYQHALESLLMCVE